LQALDYSVVPFSRFGSRLGQVLLVGLVAVPKRLSNFPKPPLVEAQNPTFLAPLAPRFFYQDHVLTEVPTDG
jgi:hypothetical protein